MGRPPDQCISLGFFFSIKVHTGLEKPKEIQCFAGILLKKRMKYLGHLGNLGNLAHVGPNPPAEDPGPCRSFGLMF